MKNFLKAVLSVSLLAAPAVASASPGLPGGQLQLGPRTESHLRVLMKAVRATNLSPAQQSQIDGVIKAHLIATKPLRRWMKQLRREIAAKLGAPTVANEELALLQKLEAGAQHKLLDAETKVAEQVRAVLSTEQLSKVGTQLQSIQKRG